MVAFGQALKRTRCGGARRKFASRLNRCRVCIDAVNPGVAIVAGMGGTLLLALIAVNANQQNEDTADANRCIAKDNAEDGMASARPELPADLEEALWEFGGDLRGPWRTLGLDVRIGDDAQEIRTAYRRAVRDEHPDRSEYPDAEKRFRRVCKAYALLMDDVTRTMLLEAYDRGASNLEELGASVEKSSGSGSDGRSSAGAMTPLLTIILLFVISCLGMAVQIGLDPAMQVRVAAPRKQASAKRVDPARVAVETPAQDSAVAVVQ